MKEKNITHLVCLLEVVLSGPGLPEALVSDLPVSSMDLPPTLLSLAGIPVPDSWPGRDLVAALAGQPGPELSQNAPVSATLANCPLGFL